MFAAAYTVFEIEALRSVGGAYEDLMTPHALDACPAYYMRSILFTHATEELNAYQGDDGRVGSKQRKGQRMQVDQTARKHTSWYLAMVPDQTTHFKKFLLVQSRVFIWVDASCTVRMQQAEA